MQKTKEELLKIYSAYLPYNLSVKLNTDDKFPDREFTLNSIKCDDIFYLENMKPVIYSMDMLTKEIEHKGERFIPAKLFYDCPQEILRLKKRPLYHSYKIIDKLLEWHFNVFGLDESEYIKKETLK